MRLISQNWNKYSASFCLFCYYTEQILYNLAFFGYALHD